MVASIGSSFDEMLFTVIEMGFGLADSELLDGFAADDSPTSVFLDFVESPQARMVFELEKPKPMSRPIRTAGECNRCFGLSILGDTSISLGSTSSFHAF